MIDILKGIINRKKQPTIDDVIDRLSEKLKEGFIKSKFAEVNDSIKYVATIDTHEIVWMNNSLIKLIGDPNWKGKKCYELLQDIPAPCSFCTNDELTEDGKVVQWVHENKKLGRTFLVRDFSQTVDGVRLRYENAIDITNTFKDR